MLSADVQPIDCLCAGILVADHVGAPIERMPHAGELAVTEQLYLTLGGCAANVAVDLAGLRRSVAVAGSVGGDVFGRFIREQLESAGVNCELLSATSARATSGTLIINVKGEDRRFVHAIGANVDFTGREIPTLWFERCRVLYLGGYGLYDSLSPNNVAELFESARSLGVRTVLDVVLGEIEDYAALLRPVLPFVDFFLPNVDEARVITGLNDPVQQAERFCEFGAKCVVVTCGENGAIAVADGRRLRIDRYQVDVIDGTGSGDAFAAGLIYGLLKNASLEDCLCFGAAMGASSVTAAGATTGTFNAAQLEEFVTGNELAIEAMGD